MPKSLDALHIIRNTDIFIDFETDYQSINDIAKEELDIIEEDLEILELLKQFMFFRESYYVDQANWGEEYISMSYIDKTWTDTNIYNKVKEWCFKNKIRGTENGN